MLIPVSSRDENPRVIALAPVEKSKTYFSKIARFFRMKVPRISRVVSRLSRGPTVGISQDIGAGGYCSDGLKSASASPHNDNYSPLSERLEVGPRFRCP